MGVDIGHYSIHETKKRILKIPHSAAFDIFIILGSHYPNSLTQGQEADSAIDHVILEDKSAKGLLKNFSGAKLKARVNNKKLEISVIEFTPSKPVDISEKHNFVEYIDFWAIDWNYKDDNFRAMWYSFREMKGKKVLKNVETSATYYYSDPGDYIVETTIVDVFGNNIRQSIVINIR